MYKTMYLITFIAFFLANSQISLGQVQTSEKMESKSGETCGKLLSSIFVIENNKEPSLTSVIKLEEEFCDGGQNEIDANYEIAFYDAFKKKLYAKRVFLNPNVFVEKFDFEKDKFAETQILKGNNSRILKAPIVSTVKMYEFYSIKDLVKNKETELKKMTLSP